MCVPVVNHWPVMEAGLILLGSVTMSRMNWTVNSSVPREGDVNTTPGSVNKMLGLPTIASSTQLVILKTQAVLDADQDLQHASKMLRIGNRYLGQHHHPAQLVAQQVVPLVPQLH